MEIIIKPILTEKMTIQGEKLNRYGFIVDVRANKLQIRNAVEQLYNVVGTTWANSRAATPRRVFWRAVLITSRRRSSP